MKFCTSVRNFFSSAVVFRSLRRTTDEGGLPTLGTTTFELAGALFEVDATDASLSLLDSPGDALRFLRFLLGLPFNFGAKTLFYIVYLNNFFFNSIILIGLNL